MRSLSIAPFAAFFVLSPLFFGCSDDAASPDSTSSTGSGGSGGSGGAGGGDAWDCPESGISKGPWTVRGTETGVTLRWEACAPDTVGDVTLTPEGGAASTVSSTESLYEVKNTYDAPLRSDVPKDLAGTYYMHEVVLSDLEKATCYSYALAADPALTGRFCTSRATTDDFSFFSWGDTNPGLTNDTAKLLALVVPEKPDFTAHLGDIQYYSSFLETYASWFPIMQPMLSMGPFYPAVGNHESEKDGEFEDRYQRYWGPEDATGYFEHSSGGVFFFVLDTEQDFGLASPQGGWLTSRLAEAAATPGFRFSVIQMHRPFATCGDSDYHPKEREELLPSFTAYGVALVLQGHMHGYERFTMDGITYITAGGGGGLIGNIDENISREECAFRHAAAGEHHGVVIDVKANGFSGRAIAPDGSMLDEFTHDLP